MKRGFTLVELLIIVAIIGILSTVLMVGWFVKSRDKASINSYKSSMRSVQTALELCMGTGGISQSGLAGSLICGGSEKYPIISGKCNSVEPYFYVSNPSGNNWSITTSTDASGTFSWDCRGCRIECRVTGCEYIETSSGDCFNN